MFSGPGWVVSDLDTNHLTNDEVVRLSWATFKYNVYNTLKSI